MKYPPSITRPHSAVLALVLSCAPAFAPMAHADGAPAAHAGSARPARAADAPPSDASLQALFDVMHASKMIDGIWSQMSGMMDSTIQQANSGQPLNEAQKAIASDLARQMADTFRESLSWEKLEPVMKDVYRQTFSQSDIDGMVAFYRSPAGQSMVTKMPTAMQHSMEGMQGLMREMMPKIQKLAQEAAARIKAAADPAPAAQP